MFTANKITVRNKILTTTLATLAWIIVMLGWMATTWNHTTLLQNLIGLAITTLLFAAFAGIVWVGDQGLTLATTILLTLGWISLALYWIGFAWSGHTLLQNGAVLIVSFLVWRGTIAVLWLAGPTGDVC